MSCQFWICENIRHIHYLYKWPEPNSKCFLGYRFRLSTPSTPTNLTSSSCKSSALLYTIIIFEIIKFEKYVSRIRYS